MTAFEDLLLKEDGDQLLKEDGFAIVLLTGEYVTPTDASALGSTDPGSVIQIIATIVASAIGTATISLAWVHKWIATRLLARFQADRLTAQKGDYPELGTNTDITTYFLLIEPGYYLLIEPGYKLFLSDWLVGKTPKLTAKRQSNKLLAPKSEVDP